MNSHYLKFAKRRLLLLAVPFSFYSSLKAYSTWFPGNFKENIEKYLLFSSKEEIQTNKVKLWLFKALLSSNLVPECSVFSSPTEIDEKAVKSNLGVSLESVLSVSSLVGLTETGFTLFNFENLSETQVKVTLQTGQNPFLPRNSGKNSQ